MSALKSFQHCHVAWSRNHKDKFVAISSDVKLYEFTNQQQLPDSPRNNKTFEPVANEIQPPIVINQRSGRSNHQLPDQFINSRLIATGPEISSFKAAACYPGSITDDDTLVAISCGGTQNTGKIVLVCLRPAGMYSIDNYVHVDLVAKRALCNDVDWCYVNNSLLATAWDRHKVDNSLQIFDINRIIETSKYSFNFSATPNNRPVFDGCSNDSINSLEWFRKEQSIVCGVNGKQIRIFDIRDLTKPKLTTPPTRAVHGVTVDPYSDKRFASYVDNTLYIWDTRVTDKPLVTIVESKAISHISWCPTRNHTFSALMAGEDFVKIYDIQQASLFSDDFEAKIVERLIHPFAQASKNSSSSSPTATVQQSKSFDQPTLPASMMGVQSMSKSKQITSYDWHPTSEFRIIAISNTRDVIALNICDRITLNWSPICEIVWTKGKKILQCLDPRDEKYKTLDDISVNMRHRAITNYGMIVEDGPHHQRGDDSDLIGLLRWVKLAKSLDITSKKTKQQYHNQHNGNSSNEQKICAQILGVGSLLRDSLHQTPSRTEVKTINWKGAAANSCVMSPIRFQVYHSELRSRALLLCDWIPDIDNISQTIPIIDYLEKEGNYMRAAAIAVFNMRLQRAIDSLTMGATRSDPNLSSVAMALSGYTGERTSMWREMCQSLKNQLTNPYMKAMFAFLTTDNDTGFHEIIYDKELILADRVAFSLLYLPDDKLNNYLTETMSFLVDNGDLNGILLTGITSDGLSLLQRYIEISSDIQSVSLIVLHSLPSAICNDQRAQLWVECYRELLDCWRLWHQRALFDNLWYGNSLESVKPPKHILISCNYCGNSINNNNNNRSQPPPPPPPLQSSSTTNQPSAQTASSAQQAAAITTTDYYQTQQVVSSVPVAMSGMSINSVASNSSSATSTRSSVSTAISASTATTTTTRLIPSGGQNLTDSPSPSNNAIPEQPLVASQAVSPPVSQGVTGASSANFNPKTSSNLQTPSRQMGANLPPSGSTPIATAGGRSKSCSNCKKCSYAKCCLCLTQLGSNQLLFDNKHSIHQAQSKNRRPMVANSSSQAATLNASQIGMGKQSLAIRTNPFSNWFSWCQTCRHGAHSAHLLSWFSENSECPVSGCDCRCMNLDSRTKLDDLQRC